MHDQNRRSRGRPRIFDPEKAVVAGQRLFHAHGYEQVGLAALTAAIGVNPPSFYAAFGSKAQFFGRVLDRYAAAALALEDILRPGRRPVEALADLLQRAASSYAADPDARGCLVLEALRGDPADEHVRLARLTAERRREQLHAFIAASHPAVASAATDFVASTMSGLSASAREGMEAERLLAVARLAAGVLPSLLAAG
ncbi:TetR/AcrR family transcriptional regulator [Sphingomonas abietis]|uniref:TetR/AcrR family transcriptional regulator n=1 Tax=Sphingomonas abietis TaxID=3012344 RepID=A0ABY7NSU0_9SPHN|nr:TetR/AcrR family transcriptional regulator [Sphingomonas abietis]WBO23713.1 TetR/AcrR family transcriptional regulator [Sphingomonas abietis]